MNDYSITTIKVGDSAEFERTITDSMMQAFLEITGDDNPLHVDEQYAKSKGFVGKVCYGALCSAFFSTLAGVYLPGKRCLLHGIDSKYKKPVFVGDTLTVQGSVVEVSEVFNEITVKATIKNQHAKVVTRAVIKAGILEEREQ